MGAPTAAMRLAGAGAALLLLAGCGGGAAGPGKAGPGGSPELAGPTAPAPGPAPSVTPSPSGWANTSPGEQAPARPADAFSAAGAAAFAVFSEQAWDWAMATGDTSLVRAVSDPDCSDCSDFADLVEQDVADGMRYVGGRVVLRGPATLDSPLSVAGTAVTVPISAGEWSVYDAAGNPYGDPQPAREVDDQRTLVWRSDRWWVAG